MSSVIQITAENVLKRLLKYIFVYKKLELFQNQGIVLDDLELWELHKVNIRFFKLLTDIQKQVPEKNPEQVNVSYIRNVP